MELKLRVTDSPRSKILVLIVPLWNWNEVSAVGAVSAIRSNCTFMELKYDYAVSARCKFATF